MKHFITTALLCGSALALQAQIVVITDKDGIPHKFKADDVREITFEKIEDAGGYDFQFETLTVNPWSKTNVGVSFSLGENLVSLDLYQPSALYLLPGTYKVDPACGDYSIDPGYSTIVIDGNKEELQSGEMKVSQNGDDYVFDMNFLLVSGQELKGKYSGPLNAYSPVISFDLTGCAYANMNEPASNGFYYNFNDSNWKLEMRLELFSDGTAPSAGVYTFSDTMENGTASSYINLYSPYNETTKFTEGTVNVSGEGENTVVEIEGTLGIGLKMKAKFQGTLPARPVADVPKEVKFDTVSVDSYGKRNETVTLSNGSEMIVLDFYQPEAWYLLPGTYTIAGGNSDFTIDPSYSSLTIDGAKKDLTGGSVEIKLEGEAYTISGEAVYTDGSMKFTYEGVLPNFGPVISFDLTGCAYANVNEPASNGFYYNFNDSNWKLEMRLELFSDGTAPSAGVYTFSDTMENGTASSYINLYSPYNETTKFTEGTVNVSGEGENTVVEIEGTLGIGLKMKAKYQGTLPARPVAE
ncbi:MAG: hypothetical protein NC095_09050 [Muribaculum sp.]|nr:hypothetical protein [Muribaculum sp.]